MWFSMAMLVITRWYMEIPISKPTITGPWQWHEGWNPQRTRSTWGKVTEIAIWDWYSSWKDGDQQHWTGFTWDDDHTSWGPRRLRLCGDQSRLVHEQGDFRPPRWVQKKGWCWIWDVLCVNAQRRGVKKLVVSSWSCAPTIRLFRSDSWPTCFTEINRPSTMLLDECDKLWMISWGDWDPTRCPNFPMGCWLMANVFHNDSR